MFDVIEGCRSCGNPELLPVLDLGKMPLADGLVPADHRDEPEPKYPLTVVFCPRCSLVQTRETVPPGTLFGEDYPYYSSFSDTLLEHSRQNVEGLVERYRLGGDDLVVELASNDGYLLQYFVTAGVPVLGIDPSPGPARAAEERGIPTLCEFFDVGLAERLVGEGRRASVVIGNNVLAHVPDQNRFVAAIGMLLADDGVAVIEVPYVKDLVDHCEFDTIYHEHHCYFSVTSLVELFGLHGLTVNRVEHLPIHGGSLRVHASHRTDREESVEDYLRREREVGLTGIGYYLDFAERVHSVKRRLVALVDELLSGGARLAGYGAAAKGAILLNYTGIGADRLAFVVDRNVHKQGKFMPGVGVPVVAPDRIASDPPDYLLILAWNFKDEIMRQQAGFAGDGGRFIVPIPEPVVV